MSIRVIPCYFATVLSFKQLVCSDDNQVRLCDPRVNQKRILRKFFLQMIFLLSVQLDPLAWEIMEPNLGAQSWRPTGKKYHNWMSLLLHINLSSLSIAGTKRVNFRWCIYSVNSTYLTSCQICSNCWLQWEYCVTCIECAAHLCTQRQLEKLEHGEWGGGLTVEN